MGDMVRALPDSLSELIGLGGCVRVKCRRCGREARFSATELSRWLRLRGRRDDWRTIRTKFICKGLGGEGCGSRNVEVTYELDAPEPPPPPPRPLGGDCPPGINAQEWATSDRYERKRLVRRSRS